MTDLPLTAEEHFALTAVLRSALSSGALKALGLEDLTARLTAPYRAELERKLLAEYAIVMHLPSLYGGPTLQADQLVLNTDRSVPGDFQFLQQVEPPVRLVVDITGGSIHSVDASVPVDVLFISNDDDDVANFDRPCLVPESEDMDDPHAWFRWNANTGCQAEVNPSLCAHYFNQLED